MAGWPSSDSRSLTGGPFGARVLDAQGPPDLEALHQRLLPVFELAGVVFTDADETSGRLVVGVLDRGVEGLVRDGFAGLGVPPRASTSLRRSRFSRLQPFATIRARWSPACRSASRVRVQPWLQRHSRRCFWLCHGVSLQRQQGTVDGTQYYQPLNQVPAEFIGTETADPRLPAQHLRLSAWTSLPVFRLELQRGRDGVDLRPRHASRRPTGPNNGSLEVAGTFNIGDSGAATVGQTANKVGRRPAGARVS